MNPSALDDRLRATFARSAADAPLPNPEVHDLPLVAVRDRGLRAPAGRRGRTTLLALTATAAAVVVLVATVRTVRHDDGSPAFQPAGVEVPLHQIDPPPVVGQVAAPDTIVGLQVPGHPAIAVYTTVMYQDGTLVEMRCTGSNGSAGCAPTSMAGVPNLTWTSTVDNREGEFNLFEWSNVPAGVAFVGWQSPTGPMWQRPVAGFVGFPFTQTAGQAPLIAFDSAGNVVDVIDELAVSERLAALPGGAWQTDPAAPGALAVTTVDNLTGEQRGQLSDLGQSSVTACLARSSTWDECVAGARAEVESEFTAIGGEMVPYVAPTTDSTTDVSTPTPS
jgi:hypothetical protein